MQVAVASLSSLSAPQVHPLAFGKIVGTMVAGLQDRAHKDVRPQVKLIHHLKYFEGLFVLQEHRPYEWYSELGGGSSL